MNIYPFIEAEQAGNHNVKRACELLKVSRAAYYTHAAARAAGGAGGSVTTPSWSNGSGITTPAPRAATERRVSTPTWPPKAAGTAVNAWRG